MKAKSKTKADLQSALSLFDNYPSALPTPFLFTLETLNLEQIFHNTSLYVYVHAFVSNNYDFLTLQLSVVKQIYFSRV